MITKGHAVRHALCVIYNGSKRGKTRILYEVLRAVEHQRFGDAVLCGVGRHVAAEEAQVDDVDLRIVLHGELGKRVAVGILDEQELAALSAAGNDRLRLIGVQKHGILVAAIKIWA